MSYTASDFNLMANDGDNTDLSEYTIPSETYTSGNLYILVLSSTDQTSPAIPSIPVTSGLTWALQESFIDDNGDTSSEGIACYWALCGGNTTATTTVTYDSTQLRCYWQIFEITKANSEVIQSSSAGAGADTITINLADPIDSAGLVLSSFYVYNPRTWGAGGGQTSLSSDTTSEFTFGQYNLGTYQAIPATIIGTLNKVGIAVEIVESTATPSEVITMHTLHLTDDGLVSGNDVICESTDFALGVTAELWPAGVEANKEVATVVSAISSAPTATPQYNITFTVAPSSGAGDIVNIIYDATVGDIKSVTGGIALASDTFSDVTMTC